MNERIIKPGVVKMIIDHTKNKNKKYTQETVNDILTAFFDVVEIAISKGNSIHINGYMTIEPQYRAERKARNVQANTEIKVPPHYKVNFKSGSRFNQAAERLTERILNNKV